MEAATASDKEPQLNPGARDCWFVAAPAMNSPLRRIATSLEQKSVRRPLTPATWLVVRETGSALVSAPTLGSRAKPN